MKFSEFYHASNLIEVPDFITEISTDALMDKTDQGRVDRSERLNVKPPQVIDDENGLVRVEYNFKSKESVEGKRHWGYVIYDEKTKDVKEMWCDCKDFAYRIWAPFVKKGLSKWDIPEKYRSRESQREPNPHSREWTKETNKSGKLYLCKHLYSLFANYL
jgi:hypothetical protein